MHTQQSKKGKGSSANPKRQLPQAPWKNTVHKGGDTRERNPDTITVVFQGGQDSSSDKAAPRKATSHLKKQGTFVVGFGQGNSADEGGALDQQDQQDQEDQGVQDTTQDSDDAANTNTGWWGNKSMEERRASLVVDTTAFDAGADGADVGEQDVEFVEYDEDDEVEQQIDESNLDDVEPEIRAIQPPPSDAPSDLPSDAAHGGNVLLPPAPTAFQDPASPAAFRKASEHYVLPGDSIDTVISAVAAANAVSPTTTTTTIAATATATTTATATATTTATATAHRTEEARTPVREGSANGPNDRPNELMSTDSLHLQSGPIDMSSFGTNSAARRAKLARARKLAQQREQDAMNAKQGDGTAAPPVDPIRAQIEAIRRDAEAQRKAAAELIEKAQGLSMH